MRATPEMERERIRNPLAYLDELKVACINKVVEFVESEEGLSEAEYRQAKVVQTHLKGIGFYKSENMPGIGVQNNFFLTREDAELLFEAHKEVLEARELKQIGSGRTASGSEPDRSGDSGSIGGNQGESDLVGAEIHEDV